MDPKEHQLSEEEINKYGKELDELFQSLIDYFDKETDSDKSENTD